MTSLIGQILGDRYQLQSLLGHTTGRRTFLATDLQSQSTVVIKLVLFGPDFTWDDLKLFQREADTLKTLDHPALPHYLNSFQVDTKLGKGFALVQDYIAARSLQDWVQSGRRFSEAELQTIARDLLAILDYLHNRQPPVIHRDIKPSNILLGDRSDHSPGQVYLVDFGSVQTVSHGGTITVVGTYGYMPPEQFGGHSTPASDLYGLGTTLIYMATGKHPADLPQDSLRIEFEALVTLNQPFIRWIQWLTEPSLSKRPVSAQQALQKLNQNPSQEKPKPQASLLHASLSSCPAYSHILICKTSTTFELQVPSTQLAYAKAEDPKSDLRAGAILILLFVLSMMLLGPGATCFFIPLLLILASIGRAFAPIKKSANYQLILHLENRENLLSLYTINPNEKIFYRRHLKSIAIKSVTPVKRKLTMSFYDFRVNIYGRNSEIQWLYDEFEKVTSMKNKCHPRA
jgi:serine/threonine protein kinase